MNRWTLAFLILALSTSAMAHRFQHGPFTGFYLGGNAGVVATQANDDGYLDIQFNNVNEFLSSNPKSADTSGGAGIALGYSFRIEKMFRFGIEGRLNFEDVDIDYSKAISVVNATDYILDNSSLQLEKDYAVLAKLGIVLNSDLQIYGLIGPDWGNFDVAANFQYQSILGGAQTLASAADSRSKYKSALLLGLGMEYLITRCTSIGLEYNYIDYGHIDFPGTLTSPFFTNGVVVAGESLNSYHSFDAKMNRFTLNFNFYFA